MHGTLRRVCTWREVTSGETLIFLRTVKESEIYPTVTTIHPQSPVETMHTNLPPALSPDEIDDLLYFTRANEAEDLQQTLTHLTQKHSCHARAVLEACVDPDTGNTAIHYCSANGFAHLLPTLLSQLNSGDPNRAADGKVVGSLLFNAQNAQGNTPLHWAAYNGHLEVVKLLVAAGADMWIKNAAGHLAMFEAERAEKGEVVQFLSLIHI